MLALTDTKPFFSIAKMSALGLEVRNARRRLRFTLTYTASKCGISPATLSLIERGLQTPSPHQIVKMATVLRSDADQWCGLIGKITPEAEKWFAQIAAEDPHLFRTLSHRRN